MIKKKNIIISFTIAVILCATVMISGCTDYETYINNDYSFSLQYPETWTIKEENTYDGMTVTFTDSEGESTVFLAVLTIQSYETTTLEDIAKVLNQMRPAGASVEEQYTTFNGQEAYEEKFNYEGDDKKEYQGTYIAFIEGQESYVFASIVNTDDKDTVKTADKIMNSFTFEID